MNGVNGVNLKVDLCDRKPFGSDLNDPCDRHRGFHCVLGVESKRLS